MERVGRVERIHITPDTGDPMKSVNKVEAVANRGLRGDRYFKGQGLWNKLDEDRSTQQASDVTFIELETLKAIEQDYEIRLEPGVHRRNVTTRDVALNHLVDRRFKIGEAVFKGDGLCEPCGYLQSMVGEDGLGTALTHRGGLDASIIKTGQIKVSDKVLW